jgi:ATP-dependent helicase YprA (DUF1998 family)
MDVFKLNQQIVDDYSNYIQSFIRIKDDKIRQMVAEAMQNGLLWPEPLIQMNPSFAPGETVEALVQQKVLHADCAKVFCIKSDPTSPGKPMRLHRHQVDAIRAAKAGDNYVLTTGTGSGKSMAYIVPIVDHVLQSGSGKGIRAIVVYPMNALANSQEGELEKFLNYGFPNGQGPVTFAKYTGQESETERQRIRSHPPDILLTNYVMLELILTRPHEKTLISAAQNLKFLVLDELHTYRGRQGADVAMLVRRVRNYCGGGIGLQYVGTSATLAGPGTFEEQRNEVARVATQIFGAPVRPERVIGETLRRSTPNPDYTSPAYLNQLRKRVAEADRVSSQTPSEVMADPLSMWIESHFGVRLDEESGRLKRAIPCRLHGDEGAAEALSGLTGLDTGQCAAAIKQVLLKAFNYRDPVTDFPLFAFRLHQFFGRGDTVYATLETPQDRYATVHGQLFKPGDRTKILAPLVFCRECGQEYYSVHIVTGKDSKEQTVVGRDFDDDTEERGVKTPGYLRLTAPLEADDLPTSSYRFITPAGTFSKDGLRFVFLDTPFTACSNCGVEHSKRQRKDFAKLGTLGSEGRSTATTILSLAVVRSLRERKELERKARKLLSFTDNRQDASLQAGHLNDFLEVGWLRSALYAAVLAAGKDGISHEELTDAVFAALNLPLEMYAKNPEQADYLTKQTNRALKQVLGYRLYLDLKRGWRITSPNLEQCGLLEIKYPMLDEVCHDPARWQNRHELLVGADPERRTHICQVLLDYLRRELAISVDYLNTDYQEKLQQLSSQHLIEPWAIDEDERMVYAAKAYPRTRQEDYASNVYISPRGGFGQFLRRQNVLGSPSQPDIATTAKIISDLLAVMCEAGMLEQVDQAHDGTPGYQLSAAAMVWQAGDGTKPSRDPIRVPRAPRGGSVNEFFVEFYKTVAHGLLGVRAREHTAQVPYAFRLEREEEFRSGHLPILYCSPTMELGIDIAQLNVVNMRNVPPTPANYAQRSGRAGRSGQPALVFTYCSAGSPHDQYFFKRPHLMVAGEVTPPRIDLANEDLVRSHIHSIWLAETGLDLGSSLKEILDLSGEQPTLELKPEVKDALACPKARRRAMDRAEAILKTLEPDLGQAEWYKPGWLEKDVLNKVLLSFEEACERWRGLYRAAIAQRGFQHRIIGDVSRSHKERQKAATLRKEAESQINLLSGADVVMQSDFYSYRYFASEGFLPGYNFPRLPLSAYIPGRRPSSGKDEYLNRPRFLAISEFGPRSIIYHEGSRYMTDKVIMPVSETDPTTGQAKICHLCGYHHEGKDKDVCEHCTAQLEPALRDMFRLQNVSTRRRERINSDEEERLRMGFELRTAIRFKETAGKKHCRTARAQLGDMQLAELTYGSTATIWRINLGLNRRKERHVFGFPLDLDKGRWVNENQLDEQPDPDDADVGAPRVKRVVPFVEDRRNCLLFRPVFDRGLEEGSVQLMASLQAVVKQAIQVKYQLEDGELAAEPLPDKNNRRMILFYEAAEGGAGVLRRLVDDPNALAEVAREALSICHFHPETGADLRRAPRAKEDCEAACYDCLMTYANQPDHIILDRQSIKPYLLSLMAATVHTSPTEETRAEHLARLKRQCGSELEKAWLDHLEAHNLRLPSAGQQLIPGCNTRPDFLYSDQKTVIYVDGPIHDYPDRAARDKAQEECLEDLGYRVIRFSYNEQWVALLERYPQVFGGLK